MIWIIIGGLVFFPLMGFIAWQWYKAEIIEEVDDEKYEDIEEMSDEEFGEITIDQLIN